MIFAAFALSACANGTSDRWSGSHPGFTEADRGAFSADCAGASPEDCVPALAALFSTNGDDWMGCSGFLIASDRLATAKHCLPPSAQIAGARLERVTTVSFPQTGQWPAEKLDASEVLAITAAETGDGLLGPDWAILRVSPRTPRPPLRVNVQGARDGERIDLLAFDPVRGGKMRFKIASCSTTHGPWFMPMARNERSGFWAGVDCDARPGNSGGALAGEARDARAIADMRVGKNKISSAESNAYVAIVDPSAIGTSFACIDAPAAGLSRSPRAQCEREHATPATAASAANSAMSLAAANVNGEVERRFAAFVSARERAGVAYEMRRAAAEPEDDRSADGLHFYRAYEYAPRCAGPQSAPANKLIVYDKLNRRGRVVPEYRFRQSAKVGC